MIREVEMVCDLLSVFDISKTTCESKLKTSVTKFRLRTSQEEEEKKRIDFPEALEVLCITFHKAFYFFFLERPKRHGAQP